MRNLDDNVTGFFASVSFDSALLKLQSSVAIPLLMESAWSPAARSTS
jgi:hypothetical protein